MDDIRPVPDGFELTHSVNETLNKIISNTPGSVTVLSLDNDLGEYHNDGGDGFNVVNKLAEIAYTDGIDYWPSILILHTSNSVERDNMAATAIRYGNYSRPKFNTMTIGDNTDITVWIMKRN